MRYDASCHAYALWLLRFTYHSRRIRPYNLLVFSLPFIFIDIEYLGKNCDGITFRIQVHQNQEGSVLDMKLVLVLVWTRMCHMRLLE